MRAVALITILTVSAFARAGELPANTWVKAPDTDAVKKLRRFRAMISGAMKPRNTNWLFQAKKAMSSASSCGAWVSDKRTAIFVGCSAYSGNFTYRYDPAKGGSWTEVLKRREGPRGWTNLRPAGDKIGWTLKWASLCYDPVNKEVLLFGGNSSDPGGSPGTMTYSLEKNAWTRRTYAGLPLFKPRAKCEALRLAAHRLEGRTRSRLHLAETNKEAKEHLGKAARELAEKVEQLAASLPTEGVQEKEQVAWAKPELNAAVLALKSLDGAANAAAVAVVASVSEHLRAARDLLAVQPPPRANSQLAYDAGHKSIVLFGGDHLDYLMSDTWLYDCTTRRWRQRQPAVSPAPRGGHALLYLPKSGKIALVGGYAYGSEEGYSAADYRQRPTELWAYGVPTNRWDLIKRWPIKTDKRGKLKGVAQDAPLSPRSGVFHAVAGDDDVIVYGGRVCRVDASAMDVAGAAKYGVTPGTVARRTGKYVPTWWDAGIAPDAAANEKRLASLPANEWVALKPPKVLGRNRDWGTATFDTDRLQILFFSGGHCAYSGTDVAVYSTRANTWRLSATPEMPIQFCRGTGYHAQRWSFGGRPWMSSHTYKLYAYDPAARKMICSNRNHTHLFDPATCDWEWPPIKNPFAGGWTPKFCTAPDGVIVWAPPAKRGRDKGGGLWRFDPAKRAWRRLAVKGGKVPGTPNDDYGTIVYDSKRKQALLFARNGRSKKHSGAWAFDTMTGALRELDPKNAGSAPKFVRESIYLPAGDVVLFAAKKDACAVVYDVAGNRFRAVKLKDHPTGQSIGLMYDPKRGLAWAVSSNWRVKVMRFDPKTAPFTDAAE
jgi:galactose oxidase-like protein